MRELNINYVGAPRNESYILMQGDTLGNMRKELAEGAVLTFKFGYETKTRISTMIAVGMNRLRANLPIAEGVPYYEAKPEWNHFSGVQRIEHFIKKVKATTTETLEKHIHGVVQSLIDKGVIADSDEPLEVHVQVTGVIHELRQKQLETSK